MNVRAISIGKILIAACGLALACPVSARPDEVLLKVPLGVTVHGNAYSYSHAAADLKSCVESFNKVYFDSKYGAETLKGPESELVYRHAVKDRLFTEFSIYAQIHAYVKGAPGHIEISVSADGRRWTVLDTLTPTNGYVTALDRTVCADDGFPFPARQVFVRYKGAPDLRALTLVMNTFTAKFDGPPLYSRPRPRFGGRIEGCSLPLWTASSGWRVKKDQPMPDATAKGVGIRAAANEAESAQLVLTADADVADVRVDAAVKGLPADAVDVRYVRYVRSRIPSDWASMPGWQPDPLPPQGDEPLSVRKGENQSFWVTVRTPKKTRRGIYRGALTVTVKYASGRTVTEKVPLAVGVFGFELPDVMSCETTFAYYPFQLRTYHLPKTPEDQKQLKRAYFLAHRDYHACLREVEQPKVTWTGDDPRRARPVFDFTDFDDSMALMDECGFMKIRLEAPGFGNCLNASVRRDRGKEIEVFSINGVPETDPAYDRLMKLYYDGVEKHIRAKGWKIERFWCDTFDEPDEEDYPMVRKIYTAIGKYAPWLSRTLTEPPDPSLIDCVETFNPVLHAYFSKHLETAQKSGKRFTWYICNSPRAPYITDCLDHPALELRIWVWQTWMHGVKGLSLWATNWWDSRFRYREWRRPQNPYEDPVSWRWHAPGHWGNGEANLFFPPVKCAYRRAAGETFGFDLDTGPVPTQRVAMLRDGIDDYEYLTILKRLDPENPLLKVPENVCKSLTEFSVDPQHVEAHRLKLAREIERLTEKKKGRKR